MNPPPAFTGFPQKGLTFFKELAENNDKIWFDDHRVDYENYVLGPAREFIVALGKRLKSHRSRYPGRSASKQNPFPHQPGYPFPP